MKVISEIQKRELKGYLIEDEDKTFLAEAIFTTRRPRSRVTIDVVKDLESIISDRRNITGHPAYVKYIDVKQINGEYCLIREGDELYRSLLAYCEENNPSLDKVIEWIITLGEVMKELEDRGQNIPVVRLQSLKVDNKGNLKIIDPAITEMIEQYQSSNLTYPSKEIYYPPEFYRKQSLDERGRIYSSGIILYYLLTGKEPFLSKDKADLIDEVLHTDPVEPCYLNPEIASKLSDFILKLLEKDRGLRVQNWTDFLEQLQELKKSKHLIADEEERISHRNRADKILKASRRRLGMRSFWRKRWVVIAIAVACMAVFWGIGLLDDVEPVVTSETTPEQVVEIFYKGINNKHFEHLEATCTLDLKHLENMVLESYVIERVTNAYSTDGTVNRVFGIEEFSFEKVKGARLPTFKVNYIFYTYRNKDKREEARMEDLVVLDKLHDKWQIVKLEGDINYVINGETDKLLAKGNS